MFEYPAEIFGAKMREEKFGEGEEQYILYCYDIFGGTYSVRVDGYFISSRFDYGDHHSSFFVAETVLKVLKELQPNW